MDVEVNRQINKDIQEYQLRQYTVLETIQKELLENNKYLEENSPYLNKLFFNDITNYTTYVNEYGFLITFLDKSHD